MGFYSNHLCERGSEVALYDYADFAEVLRGGVSYVLYDASSPKNVASVVRKFRARFGDRLIALGEASSFFLRDIAPAIERHGITHCYITTKTNLRCGGLARCERSSTPSSRLPRRTAACTLASRRACLRR